MRIVPVPPVSRLPSMMPQRKRNRSSLTERTFEVVYLKLNVQHQVWTGIGGDGRSFGSFNSKNRPLDDRVPFLSRQSFLLSRYP